MPQGRPIAIPDDGLTTRARRQAALLAVHTATARASRRPRSDGVAGVERGLVGCGVPVRQERQVESGRGGRVSRAGPSARRAWGRRSRRVAQDGCAAGRGRASTATTTITPRPRPTAGPRSPVDWLTQRHDFYRARRVHLSVEVGLGGRRRGGGGACRPARHPACRHHRARCPAALLDAADLVTEMTKVKHPMDAGRKGQKGIEW